MKKFIWALVLIVIIFGIGIIIPKFVIDKGDEKLNFCAKQEASVLLDHPLQRLLSLQVSTVTNSNSNNRSEANIYTLFGVKYKTIEFDCEGHAKILDWKIYTDKALRYTIRYPKDWWVRSNDKNVNVGPPGTEHIDTIWRVSTSPSAELSLDSALKRMQIPSRGVDYKTQDITIDGVQAKHQISFSTNPIDTEKNVCRSSVIVFEKNGITFEIWNNCSPDEQYTFEEFYRSFKFVQ